MYEGLDDELRQMDERERESRMVVEGVQLDDPISSLALQSLTVARTSTSLREGHTMMVKNHVGCLLIVEDEKLVGILTERDIISRFVGKGLVMEEVTVDQFMTANPNTLHMDDPIAFALNRMYDRGYRHVPVLDDEKKPIGFVSSRDIINHIGKSLEKEVLNLPPLPRRDGGERFGG